MCMGSRLIECLETVEPSMVIYGKLHINGSFPSFLQCCIGSIGKLQKLPEGTWNVSALMGKEPELVEKFWLDTAVLTLTRRKALGTNLVLAAPRLSACALEFTPVNERAASLRLWVEEKPPDCCLCLWPKRQLAYPPFLESLKGLLENAAFCFFFF